MRLSKIFNFDFVSSISNVRSFLGSTSNFVSKFFSNVNNYYNQGNYNPLHFMDRLGSNVNDAEDIIPKIFGRSIVDGRIIWVSPVLGNSEKRRHYLLPSIVYDLTKNNYQGSISFAVSICDGKIDELINIYINDALIDINKINHVLYKGSDEQIPNSTLQSYLGIENTPAFRGLSYIVLNDIPLSYLKENFPIFKFEIFNANNNSLASEIRKYLKCISIIPGCGEFVYNTLPAYKTDNLFYNDIKIEGNKSILNINNNESVSDFSLSVSQLKKDLPNVEWTSLIVSWFADNLDIGLTDIYPAIEYDDGVVSPHDWQVADRTRSNAKKIGKDINGNILYGGTPADISVLQGVTHLKESGYKVCFYPMLFLDLIDKPWRGHMTGKPNDIDAFFLKYEKFILHYAHLLQHKVDAFIIGSEFVKITSIADNNTFPAVDKFVDLAGKVREILGHNVKITYAADWSEYHHTEGGWYNLDNLWSSDNIDVIGIDAYFPLTRQNQSVYDIDKIMNGWSSGEGFDYYYDGTTNDKKNLSPQYAWKNLEYFINNDHYNPDGNKTNWIPNSKKIWFTEYGFPSVDCSTNQPNVFYSKGSFDSGFPILSKGNIDILAQLYGILATENKWFNSDIVENRFLWCWDARPYPYFPALESKWSDASSWERGHFLNGKLSYGILSELIMHLCILAGLEKKDIIIINLNSQLPYYVHNEGASVLDSLLKLSLVFNFSISMKGDKILFQKNNLELKGNILNENLLENEDNIFLKIQKNQSYNKMYETFQVYYNDINNLHKENIVEIKANNITNGAFYKFKASIPCSQEQAKRICRNIFNILHGKNIIYNFSLPLSYLNKLLPSDQITLENKLLHVDRIQANDNSLLINAYKSTNNFDGINLDYTPQEISFANMERNPDYKYFIIDITKIFNNNDNKVVYMASYNLEGLPLNGYIGMKDDDYNYTTFEIKESVVGSIINDNATDLPIGFLDHKREILVHLLYGDGSAVYSSTDEEFKKGQSCMAIMDGRVVRFQNIEWLDEDIFKVKNLVYLTADINNKESFNDKFILLDERYLSKIDMSSIPVDSEVTLDISLNDLQNNDSDLEVKFAYKGLCNSFIKPNKIIKEKINNGILISFIPYNKSEDFFIDDFEYILNIGDINNIKRSLFINDSSFLYSNEMQMEDYGMILEDVIVAIE